MSAYLCISLLRICVCMSVYICLVYLPICIYQSLYQSIYTSIHLSISVYVCLSVYLYLSKQLSILYLSTYLSICLSIYPAVCLSVYLYICLSIYLISVCVRLSVHPSMNHWRPKCEFCGLATHRPVRNVVSKSTLTNMTTMRSVEFMAVRFNVFSDGAVGWCTV
jgi:hypothetical protein